VLVCNLGTPDAPTPRAVRRYLAEFLSDPRVVELPRVLWWPILYGVILNIRPKKSAHAYEKIWTENGSPLLLLSEQLTQALGASMSKAFGKGVIAVLAMRYGSPSIADGLEALRRANADRVLVLPLYPQYSASTTASVFDAVAQTLETWRWIPELRLITEYHTESAYIEALADSVESHWQSQGRGDRLLLSFHGLPQEYNLAGDPYERQCRVTADLLTKRLGLSEDQWLLSFQSRVGPKKWLQPYTDATLKACGKQGIDRIDVICPGFAVDCLETIEEIQILNRDNFIAAGGKELRYIPALNASAAHVDALLKLIMRHLQGWPATPVGDRERTG
jgi:ferrochelatase